MSSKANVSVNQPEESHRAYERRNTSFMLMDSNTHELFSLEDASYRFEYDERMYPTMNKFITHNTKTEESKQMTLFENLVEGYYAKGQASYKFNSALNATGNRIIVWCGGDEILSCGIQLSDGRADKPFEWLGKNFIGLALMQVRCMLREDWKCQNIYSDGKRIKKQRDEKKKCI